MGNWLEGGVICMFCVIQWSVLIASEWNYYPSFPVVNVEDCIGFVSLQFRYSLVFRANAKSWGMPLVNLCSCFLVFLFSFL